MQATFRHGDPLMADYTPTANANTGDVILLGNTTGVTCGVCHTYLTNAIQGAIAVGGGVYDLLNLNNAATYVKVWWDATNSKATTVSTNNALFGWIIASGGGGANTVCRVRHWPYV